MHKSRLFLILILFPIFFSTCIEVVDLNTLNGPTSGRLVVEGIITNEKRQHAIILSRTKEAISNTPGEKVSGAKVSITDGINEFTLSEIDSQAGVYLTDDSVAGEIGRTYTLTVTIDQTTYTASDIMEPVTPFRATEELFEQPNRIDPLIDESIPIYELSFPKVRYGVLAPAKQLLFSYDSVAEGLRQAIFYEFPRIDPQGFLLNFAGTNPTLVLEPGSTVIQFKASLSSAHYNFVRAVYAETQFRGGIFDNIPGNAPGNISNNGLGFFGASAVISRTFVVTENNLDP